MNTNVDNILLCEDQLRNTLHCDDKEKLRRKLAQLQKEYLKTAQRLQRAERLEAVKRNAKSKISLQKQEERNPGVSKDPCPTSLDENKNKATDDDLPSYQEDVQGPALSDRSRKRPMIKSTFLSDTSSQSSDLSHDDSRRSSSSLRLRSRRNRLLLKRKSAEASKNKNVDEHNESLKRATSSKNKRDQSKEKDDVVESDELFSSADSQSPALLLTHRDAQKYTGEENTMNEESKTKGDLETNEKQSNPVLSIEEEKVNIVNREEETATQAHSGVQEQLRECKENKNTGNNTTETAESQDKVVEMHEENKKVDDKKVVGLLESCTLVEGLLFPAEYYVRTTRRMTLSQSQPDIQAVILSQLSHRRSRGRGRGCNRKTLSQANCVFPTTQVTSPDVHPSSVPDAIVSAQCNQNFSEMSNTITSCQMESDAGLPHPVTPSNPSQRRRKRRGRGRHSTSQPSRKLSRKQSLGNLSASVFSSQSPLRACETVPEPKRVQSSSDHVTVMSQSSSRAGPTLCCSASEQLERIDPTFLNSDNNPSPLNKDMLSPSSLLLPSTTSPIRLSPFPLTSLFSGWLADNLTKFDVPQDFHLPDDQFAFLKLHKLRQFEHFSTPSQNTRSSIRRADLNRDSWDQLSPVHFPLSLTPTIALSPHLSGTQQFDAQHSDLQNESLAEELLDKVVSKTDANEHDAEIQEISAEFVPLMEQFTEHRVERPEEDETFTNFSVKLQNPQNSGDRPHHHDDVIEPLGDLESNQPASEIQTSSDVQSLQDQDFGNTQAENRTIITTLHFDNSPNVTPKTCENSAALQASSGTNAPLGSPGNDTKDAYSLEDSEEATAPKTKVSVEKKTSHPQSPEILNRSLSSPPYSLLSSQLPVSTLTSSPLLPSLGITPFAGPQLRSSPSPPPLSPFPSPHSPSNRPLSPPSLYPCSSIAQLPPNQIQVFCEPLDTSDSYEDLKAATCRSQSMEETTEKQMIKCTHFLKAAVGGCLVDVCCVSRFAGDLCVAAAGKWAMCLWNHNTELDWRLLHTWTFTEPVIDIFVVPDADGLICVTLGQLEIREVRTLSCSSLMQMLVCEGIIQVVVGVSGSRVVTSSHSASGSTLQVFTLSDGGTPTSQPLASPGVCVGALAPVDGLPDALIGTDETGGLFIWNVRTSQLLCRIMLEYGLSQTACLKGFSHCGMLFVLLQHQFLSSMKGDETDVTIQDQIEKEEMRETFFSLVAINPLSGKSILRTRFHPPQTWCGRLCESDVNQFGILGLSQSGCLCVWELAKEGASQMVTAPEGEEWQLVRWGGGKRLIIGHHNGDVSLHNYS